MRFGIFLAPFHAPNENPSAAIARDIELIEHLDRLGFDEAWVGEHHSGGMEIIAAPEILIAAAAERTRRIRLGTGVVTLPFHHPFIVADRIMQLDHQTRGRVMFGVGSGALTYDAYMMGIDILKQREMTAEAIEVLIPLLSGETVTRKTAWFELKDARLQLLPFTRPRVEMAIPIVSSPAGPRTAGRFGISLLSISATTSTGFSYLADTWQICEEQARIHGQTVRRDDWRIVGPVHIAETAEQARANVRFGIQRWLHYFSYVGGLPLGSKGEGDVDADIDAATVSGYACIGTPDDLIKHIERLEARAGGFGAYLDMAHNWADFAATKRSYELIARYVMPHFSGDTRRLQDDYAWAMNLRPQLQIKREEATQSEIEKHKREQAGLKRKSSGTPA